MTYEEAIKWIKDHHCPDGWDVDCKDSSAMRVAIKALERCKMIDEAKYLRYEPREDLCEEDISYEQGYNDCLRWAKRENKYEST